jgi:hypothetical protein
VLTGLGTGSESRVYALWRDELYYGDPTGSSFAWTLVDGINGKPAMIVPILQYGNPLPRPEDTDGLLCVTKDGKVFIGSATNGWTKLTAPKLDSDTWPLALKSTDTVYCMSKAHSDDHASDAPLIAFSFSTANPNAGLRVRTSPGRLTIKDNAFAFAWRSVASASAAAQQRPVAVFLAQENSTRAAAWYAFEDGKSSLIYADQPIGVSEFAHAPVTLTQSQIAFPVGSDRVEIAQVNAEPQTVGERLNLHFAVEVPELATSAETLYVRVTAANQGAYLWTMGDKVSVMNTKRTLRVLWNRGDATSGSARHRIEFFRPEGEKRTFTLVDDAPGELRMDETSGIEAGCIVRLWNANDGGHLLRIVKGVEDGTPKTVKLDKEIDARHRNVEFLERLEGVHDKKGLLRPALRRGDLSAEISGNIANARFTLLDEKSKPIGQKNMHALDTDGSPWIVFAAAATDRSLAARFASIQMLNFFRGWVPRTASRDIDPKLSWEYWNGRSWTVLPITADETDNLLTSGKIEFEVRSDAQPTEVLGQPNHWIRARLVGGDYGQAKYITSDAANPHTVVRDPSGIHPPYVTRVQVHYEIEEGVTPDHLITLDGGVARDQSEANLTPNAIVEYAVPLADQLAHLADDAPHTRNKAGLAIYLGLDRELSGPGITLLFDVVDGAFDDAGPLQAEALIDGVFRTLMSKDGTRGLSESGIVTLALADPPQRALLFGATALHWLRFRPDPRANRETWKPRIKGVYLNAAMAVAAETVTLERLGSSDGSPGQSVVLAKTPVLQDSLVLRVREPIDEADVRRLASDGVDIVDTLGHWPGFWVRWREVPDLLGSGKQDRVYTLEDDTGRIRFGDGIRGRIPPTGADSIVAVTYRLGGGAVANGITAFSEVSLVTPLAGVQGVVTLDDAAGGIDPEDADATLSYASANLAMRDRAVTLRDFEQLTRQLVPNLAQVRARAYAHGIEIVFAMRGDEPRPTRAARRELQAALLSRADPALARPRALQAIGPNIVDARLDLKLLIDAGGPGAAIAQQAVERVTALLDPATGGLDASGWRFGTLPSGTELAASLDGISGLIALESSGLRTAGAPGVAPERIATLGRDDALRVAPSAVHIELTRARESS